MVVKYLIVALLAASVVGMEAPAGETLDLLASPTSDFGELTTSRVRQLFQTRSSATDDMVAWRGRVDPLNRRSYFAQSIAVNKCDPGQTCKSHLGTYPYEEYLIDPTGDSNQPVMKISYPKGHWSPGGAKPGGTLLFGFPYKTKPTEAGNAFSGLGASLEFDVFFPEDFDFVKGGKLPGMSGGKNNGRGCGGGVDPHDCFSYRVMWRRDGMGEAYLYAKEGGQGPEFCTRLPQCSENKFPCINCDYRTGVSWGRGSFKFQKGVWQQIRTHIILNDPGKANGYMGLEYNGKLVASFDQMNWRWNDGMKIEGIEISSWFGGSDATWAPPKDTHILLRNIKAYRTGPATTSGARDAVLFARGPIQQVVLEEKIDVSPW